MNKKLSYEQSYLIEKALRHCGYDGEPDEKLLKACFLDYVDAGIFKNLTTEEAEQEIEDGDITVVDMARSLLKVK